jgi:hypothetical protein
MLQVAADVRHGDELRQAVAFASADLMPSSRSSGGM